MIDIHQRIALLKKVHLFYDLKEDELRVLAEHLEEVVSPQGEIVFKENSIGEGFYIIYSGSVVIMQKGKGAQNPLAILGPGNYFGQEVFSSQRRRIISVITRENTSLLVLTRGIVEQLKPLISLPIVKFNFEVTDASPINGTVFISYSHSDSRYLNRLLIHLRPLEKENLIDLWNDTKLKPGDQWKIEIEHAITNAKVAILLVSPDFLASDFIFNNELPPILQKAKNQGTRIIPVILSPCRFARDENLNKFQAINDPKKPLSGVSEHEQELVFDSIAQELEQIYRKNLTDTNSDQTESNGFTPIRRKT